MILLLTRESQSQVLAGGGKVDGKLVDVVKRDCGDGVLKTVMEPALFDDWVISKHVTDVGTCKLALPLRCRLTIVVRAGRTAPQIKALFSLSFWCANLLESIKFALARKDCDRCESKQVAAMPKHIRWQPIITYQCASACSAFVSVLI